MRAYILSTAVMFAVLQVSPVGGGGFPGDYCTLKHGCVNGGICAPELNSGYGRCSCPTGYSGLRCQAACSTSADCQNQGNCTGFECSCMSGYTGGKCEIASAAPPTLTSSLLVISILGTFLTNV